MSQNVPCTCSQMFWECSTLSYDGLHSGSSWHSLFEGILILPPHPHHNMRVYGDNTSYFSFIKYIPGLVLAEICLTSLNLHSKWDLWYPSIYGNSHCHILLFSTGQTLATCWGGIEPSDWLQKFEHEELVQTDAKTIKQFWQSKKEINIKTYDHRALGLFESVRLRFLFYLNLFVE